MNLTSPHLAANASAHGLVSPTTGIGTLTEAHDLVALAFRSAQISGTQPFAHRLTLDSGVDLDALLPPRAEVIRQSTSDSSTVTFAVCGEGRILIEANARFARVEVSAATPAMAEELAAIVQCHAPPPEITDTIPVRSWYFSSAAARPVSDDHEISAPLWSEIERNYPRAVRTHLAELMAIERPAERAKVIAWSGEPGTGKTTALRALTRMWAPWCDTHYIKDPEQLFNLPHYLQSVLTDRGPTKARSDGHTGARWRLIVAEDTDVYLRATPGTTTGALGRLLNLSDGLLGQGSDTMLLFTTNMPKAHIAPAVTRPGRCLANIEFTRFSPSEARAWHQSSLKTVTEPPTLAEMYAARSDLVPIGDITEASGHDTHYL